MARSLLSRLVGLAVLVAVLVAGESPPQCCPSGWFLVRHSDNYECVPGAERSSKKDFLLVQTNSTALPDCLQPELKAFDKNEPISISPNSCLSALNGSLVVVQCPLQDDEQPLLLNVLHKCCPPDQIYDGLMRLCRPGNFTSSLLADSAAAATAAVVYANDRIDCPRSRALVEYKLSLDDLRYEQNRLVLRRQQKAFTYDEYCIEQEGDDGDGGRYLVRTCDDMTVCRQMPCIRRCCAEGEIITKDPPYCRRDATDTQFHSFESLNISGNFSKPPVFGILRNLDCKKYPLDPDDYEDAHSISAYDGSLYMQAKRRTYSNSQYCVENRHNSTWDAGERKLYTFLCFDKKVVSSDEIRFKLYPIGLLISCSFYAATLLVYLSISKLRNLPGQILICLVTSLFCAYFGIALGQLKPTSNDTICFASGFFIYFCLMAAFAWMNVMCFDIWQTFGTAKNKRGFNENNLKRFLLYSAYGWGIPCFLTTLTVLLTKLKALPESITPHFGHGRCWFTYDTLTSANLVFFSGPVCLLFLINFILFSMTLRYCNKVKKEIFRMQSSNTDKPLLKRRFFMDKARFTMNTKLFVVMGITWLLELLSIMFYDHNKTFFWAISDSFNVLLGVFVFFIFVFKKRIWQAILIKLGIQSEAVRNPRTTTMGTHSTFVQSTSMVRLNAVDGNAKLLHKGLRTPSM